jgi:hypothetical protein
MQLAEARKREEVLSARVAALGSEAEQLRAGLAAAAVEAEGRARQALGGAVGA